MHNTPGTQPDRVILKLGGSVITDKGADCAINRGGLEALATAIAGIKHDGIVIVHGAGSCGHPEAKRYHLDKGVSIGQTEGIYVTHRAVSGLNEAVVETLRSKGVAAIGVHPLHVAAADNGRLIGFEDRHLETMLALGMVPGDPRRRGDGPLTRGLYRIGRPARCGTSRLHYRSAVSGSPPMYRECWMGGMWCRKISRQTMPTLHIGDSLHTDVTGGMRGKIDELLALADAGTESEIFHVSRVRDFLRGAATGGTRVRGK